MATPEIVQWDDDMLPLQMRLFSDCCGGVSLIVRDEKSQFSDPRSGEYRFT